MNRKLCYVFRSIDLFANLLRVDTIFFFVVNFTKIENHTCQEANIVSDVPRS